MDYLDTFDWKRKPQIDVRYKREDLALAMYVDLSDAERLTDYGMMAGYVSGDRLRYLILRVAKSTVIRILRMDPPRAGELTPVPRSTSLEYSPYIHIKNVKRGCGGFSKWRVNAYQKLTFPVPGQLVDKKGEPVLVERREVTAV